MSTAAFVVAVLGVIGAFGVLVVLGRRIRRVEESLQSQMHDAHERLTATELKAGTLASELVATREAALSDRELLDATEARLSPLAAELEAARGELHSVREQLVDQVNAGFARVHDALLTEVAAQIAASTEAFEYEGE